MDSERTITPRVRCYHAIRHEFSAAIAAHLRTHKEALNDPALEQNIDLMHKLMLRVLSCVDEFDLTDRVVERRTEPRE